jgi:hypothetical protein
MAKTAILVLIIGQSIYNRFFTPIFKVVLPPGQIQWPGIPVYECFLPSEKDYSFPQPRSLFPE